MKQSGFVTLASSPKDQRVRALLARGESLQAFLPQPSQPPASKAQTNGESRRAEARSRGAGLGAGPKPDEPGGDGHSAHFDISMEEPLLCEMKQGF